MKKNFSSVSSNTRKFSVNPSFGTPDITKVSPKNGASTNGKATYFLRNPKATPTSQHSALANRTHSPRHVSGPVKNPAHVGNNTSAFQICPQQKSSKCMQSPVQKSPSYYVLKGKNFETNPNYKENNQPRTSYPPQSPQTAYNQKPQYLQQKKVQVTASNIENYPISLNIQCNTDPRQSATPQARTYRAGPQVHHTQADISNVCHTEAVKTPKTQVHSFPSEGQDSSNTIQAKSSQDNKSHNKVHQPSIDESRRKILGVIDSNIVDCTQSGGSSKQNTTVQSSNDSITDHNHNHHYTMSQPQNWSTGAASNNQNSPLDMDEAELLAIRKTQSEVYQSQESDTSQVSNKRQKTFEDSPKGRRHCERHPDKKGKYVAESEDDLSRALFYCSKCAVDLALKGTRVSEIKSSNEFLGSQRQTSESDSESQPHSHSSLHQHSQSENEVVESNMISSDHKEQTETRSSLEYKRRNQELLGFTHKVETLLERMKSLEGSVSHEKAKAINTFRSEKENLESFCRRVMTAVVEQKDNVCKSLDLEQDSSSQNFTEIAKMPTRYSMEMKQIKGDIEDNMENIMKNIEDKPYKNIMKKYEERLGLYEGFLKDKEAALLKMLVQPACQNNIEELKAKLRMSLDRLLDVSQPLVKSQKTGATDNISNLGDFENFLRSDEEEIDLIGGNTKQNGAHGAYSGNNHSCSGSQAFPQNYTLVSFENKDIFQNALNTSKEGDSSTCETVVEHEDEQYESTSAQEGNNLIITSDSLYSPVVTSVPGINGGPSSTTRKVSTNRKSGRYDEEQKRDNFEILAGPPSKQLSQPSCEAFVNFLENKINEESSSPKANYQKSLFTSPTFKDMDDHENDH